MQEVSSSSDTQKEQITSENVLYQPEMINANAQVEVVMEESVPVKVLKIDLEPVIALSRQTDAIFNINNTLSAEAHEKESIELSIKMSNNSSALN